MHPSTALHAPPRIPTALSLCPFTTVYYRLQPPTTPQPPRTLFNSEPPSKSWDGCSTLSNPLQLYPALSHPWQHSATFDPSRHPLTAPYNPLACSPHTMLCNPATRWLLYKPPDNPCRIGVSKAARGGIVPKAEEKRGMKDKFNLQKWQL